MQKIDTNLHYQHKEKNNRLQSTFSHKSQAAIQNYMKTFSLRMVLFKLKYMIQPILKLQRVDKNMLERM